MNNFNKYLSNSFNEDIIKYTLYKKIQEDDIESKEIKKEITLISTPRTGCTWLVKELECFDIGVSFEFFDPIIANSINYILNCSSFEDYENKIRKLFSNNFVFLNRLNGYQLNRLNKFNYTPNINGLVYLISRRDIVSQAYSLAKAVKTNEWVNKSADVEITQDEFKKALDDIKIQKEHVSNIPFIKEIYYEDMLEKGVNYYAKMIIDNSDINCYKKFNNVLKKQSTEKDIALVEKLRSFNF